MSNAISFLLSGSKFKGILVRIRSRRGQMNTGDQVATPGGDDVGVQSQGLGEGDLASAYGRCASQCVDLVFQRFGVRSEDEKS